MFLQNLQALHEKNMQQFKTLTMQQPLVHHQWIPCNLPHECLKPSRKPHGYKLSYQKESKRENKNLESHTQETTILANKVDAKHLFFRCNETARPYLAKSNHTWVTSKLEITALPPLIAAHSHKLPHLFPFRDWRSLPPAEHPCFGWKIFFLNSFLEVVNFRARKLSSLSLQLKVVNGFYTWT